MAEPALRPFLARIAPALRAALREDYGAAALRADLMAGAVVGVVALPLSMALAIGRRSMADRCVDDPIVRTIAKLAG